MWLITKFSELYFTLKILWLLTFLLLYFLWVPLSDALIVPKELPSILSVVYSNIPPIKKGTDSRLGFGFRLGEHADFQVIVELGPQIETRPIGNQEQTNSFNKRQVNLQDQSFIIQEETKQQLETFPTPPAIINTKDNWLQKWKGDVQKLKYIEQNGQSEVIKLPAKPYVPEETLKQLQLLYKMATSSTIPNIPITPTASTTSTTPIATTITTTTTIPTTTTSIKTITVNDETTPASIENVASEALPFNTITLSSELQETLEFLKAKFENNDLHEFQDSNIKTKSDITKDLMNVNLDE